MSDEDSDRPSFKRKSQFSQNGSARKSAKTGAKGSAGGGGGGMSFAQRMMAKMGYKEGEGLGKEGEGTLKPIEVKLRPQGAGVGTVDERTQQAKDEARRQAERKGEKYDDSEEEERKARKKRKEAAMAASRAGNVGGASTPGGGGYFRPKKPQYRTAADITAEADGLVVPNVLKSIIDATGKEQRLLTSTPGLSTPTVFTPSETEAEKIARRARRDLESYADSWSQLTERKKHNDFEERQTHKQIADAAVQTEELQAIIAAVKALEVDESLSSDENLNPLKQWDRIVSKLEDVQTQYAQEIVRFRLDEIAVAALHPMFKQDVSDWRPLESPDHLVGYFNRLRPLLQTQQDTIQLEDYDEFDAIQQHKTTSPFESLVYNIWLPKLRTTIVNDWDVHEPDPLIALVDAWRTILPGFIYDTVVNDLVVAKLSTAIQKWNPRSSLKKKHAGRLPYTWLFPWLPYLDAHHIDPTASHGLMTDVKRKFRVVLDTWSITSGVIPRLDSWKVALGSTFDDAMLRHLLPRLATHLATDFEVYPPDQDLAPLERVLAWSGYFPRKAYEQLILQEFFPKWHNTLYQWLTSGPDYDQIQQWFTWWKQQLPEDISASPVVGAEWDKGLSMMVEAMELGDRVGEELTAPVSGPMRPIAAATQPKKIPTATHNHTAQPEVVSQRDILEDWCAEESLLLQPLREAHEITGQPLFRITASATGKGGVVIYIKGDIIWAQRKGEKGVFDPIEMGAALVQRAEGR